MVEPAVYRALFETEDAAALLVEGGLVVDANARARAALDDTGGRGAIVGRELLTLLAPVQPDGQTPTGAVAELAELASTDVPRQVEWLFAGGSEPFSVRARVRGLAVGQRKVVSVSWQDATDQRLAPGTSPADAPAVENDAPLVADGKADDARPRDEKVPIVVLDGVVGVLGVSSNSQHPLTEEERELLESISLQASEALQRARLLDEARDHARRERLIRDIADRMQRATDLQSLMRIAAEQLAAALGATRAYVRMGVPEQLVRE